jgi:crotonobetainyl-CoA:carnitine CoA-transferase CaiB-like acyl-CoA transferase
VTKAVDLTTGVAGAFATHVLAQLGVEVTRLEPPGFAETEPAWTDFLLGGQQRRTLDLRTPAGREEVLAAAVEADLLFEDFGPGGLTSAGLSARRLRRANGELTIVSISPFGLTGPRRHWKANDFLLQAAGGVVQSSGWREAPPSALPPHQAESSAGLLAAAMALAAVEGVRRDERASHLDISIQEAMSTHWTREISRYVHLGAGLQRSGQQSGLQGFPHTAMTADGWLFLLALFASWEELAAFLGLDEYLDEGWADGTTRIARWPELAPRFEEQLRSRGRYEWFEAAARHRYTFAPVEDTISVTETPHAASRGLFEPIDTRDGPGLAPRLPWTSTPSG